MTATQIKLHEAVSRWNKVANRNGGKVTEAANERLYSAIERAMEAEYDARVEVDQERDEWIGCIGVQGINDAYVDMNDDENVVTLVPANIDWLDFVIDNLTYDAIVAEELAEVA